MDRFQTAEAVRRRALVVVASLPPLPLRRELEAVVSPAFREQARDAVDSLLEDRLLELVDLGSGSGIRIRLTDRGRGELLSLPGEERPYMPGRPGGELPNVTAYSVKVAAS